MLHQASAMAAEVARSASVYPGAAYYWRHADGNALVDEGPHSESLGYVGDVGNMRQGDDVECGPCGTLGVSAEWHALASVPQLTPRGC